MSLLAFLAGLILDGAVDEVAIWNRVLARNEIYLLAQTEPESN